MSAPAFGEFLLDPVSPERLPAYNALRAGLGLGTKSNADLEGGEWRAWLIREGATGAGIGILNVVLLRLGEWELGFALVPEARAKGILSALLPGFVKELGLPLYAETGESNAPAIKALERAGFRSAPPAHEVHENPSGELVRTAAFRFTPTTPT